MKNALMTTCTVSDAVNGSMRSTLEIISDMSNEEPRSKIEEARYANMRDVLANQDKIKAIFIEALDEAVYGNGGRQQENRRIVTGQEKTSWQEHLKMGPVLLDQRMKAARANVERQISELSVSSGMTMEIYDMTEESVSRHINKELAAVPAR